VDWKKNDYGNLVYWTSDGFILTVYQKKGKGFFWSIREGMTGRVQFSEDGFPSDEAAVADVTFTFSSGKFNPSR
jgi:hypothetical protein